MKSLLAIIVTLTIVHTSDAQGRHVAHLPTFSGTVTERVVNGDAKSKAPTAGKAPVVTVVASYRFGSAMYSTPIQYERMPIVVAQKAAPSYSVKVNGKVIATLARWDRKAMLEWTWYSNDRQVTVVIHHGNDAAIVIQPKKK